MDKPLNIFILTPMYGGMCCGAYTQSLLAMPQVFADGTKISYGFLFNESLIQRARNSLVHHALKQNPLPTHIMFIDSDIRFDPNDIKRMIEADKDIIGGIYPKKEINWTTVKMAMDRGVPNPQHYTGSFVVNLVDYAGEVVVPVNEPAEVSNIGTGFMLIKTEVFKALKEGGFVNEYANDVGDLGGGMQHGEMITEYFNCPIEDGTRRLLSEDYAFCITAKKAGFKIYAAPWVRLAHIGTYAFEGQLIPAPE